MALTGLVLSVLAVGAAAPISARFPAEWRRINCLRNMVGISGALSMYMADYDGELPVRGLPWNQAIEEYWLGASPAAHGCPDAADFEHSYALNSAVIGRDTRRIPTPEEVPALFESSRGLSAVGGREALVTPPRHLGWYNFGFVDGHAQSIRDDEASRLRWVP